MLNHAINQARVMTSACISEEQRRVDAIQAAVRAESRRPLFRPPPPPPEPLAPSHDLIEIRLAEELEFARRCLEAIGDQFASDPIVLHRHGELLQGFDRVAQILGHVAKVIETADKKAAIDRIGMQEMRARLTRRSL